MKKRLAWNFELNIDTSFQPPVVIERSADTHWESRFFWPEQDIIALSGLNDSFLELSRYKIKHRSDIYYLLADAHVNIKARRGELIYKPLIEHTPYANAYGKKMKLQDDSNAVISLDDAQIPLHTFSQRVTEKGCRVLVEKEALIYKFELECSAKLELARLSLDDTVYFSVGIEAHSRQLVESLTQHILGHHETSDYVTFLKHCRKK